jgi:probable DNA repair protein
VSRDALFERLSGAAGDTAVVTSTRRLARTLAGQFDAWQSARGLRAWETPRVLPFAGFVAALADSAQHDPALSGIRTPLTAAQEFAVWEAVVAASDVPLASPASAAQLASNAWSLAHQWHIAGRLRHYATGGDARMFAAWSARYEARLEAIGATDLARLPDEMRLLVAAGRVGVPAELWLAGFDERTPQQEALFDAIRSRGVSVRLLDDARAPAAARRVEAADAVDETDRMADWVAARLDAAADARIGIVVPNLGERRRSIVRALDAVLAPQALLGSPDRLRPYTVSLGGRLADEPLVATALRILRFALGAIDVADASALLRSPHVDLGPAPARDRFDLHWRRRAGRSVAVEHLLAAARGWRDVDAPALARALGALQQWRHRAGHRPRRLSEWAASWSEALRAVGFPGPTALGSTAYQALARWQELLAEFAALERVERPLEPDAALRRLARLATAATYQAEGGEPPVHVLGWLEARGLQFDHLWLAGMTSEEWPPVARPHPLLPLELQRAARMPGASVERDLERARAAVGRLLRAAPEVVASHARRDGERTLVPAAIVADWPAMAELPRAARALDAFAPVPLQRIVDASGPALPAGSAIGGGAATLTDQAACPFRAFAARRLAADSPRPPHDGFDAAERGELVHRMLASFWEALPMRTRAHVAALSSGERRAALEQAADRALARVQAWRIDALGPGLVALERRRLVGLAEQWLQFEIETRADFAVRAIEERRSLAIGPLALTGRLDRVDRLADGSTVVIDYKTGDDTSVQRWLGARPDAPQLPLYLVASEPDARAIAFAGVRRNPRLVALAADESLLPGGKGAAEAGQPDWPALVNAWRTELERLAAGFAGGAAAVDPKRGTQTCRYCDLAPLCRLHERAEEVAVEFLATDDAAERTAETEDE